VAYDIISKPLCAIFNISLTTKHFPNKWKLANVTPVHKKEDKNIIGNYRPISLLPISSKVFEKCIYKHIFNFIRDLITEHQSGFTINDSTRNQLLYIANMFSKAFLILAKPLIEYGIGVFFLNLKKMGIVEDLLLWFKDYLSNRKQRVIINGKESSWKTVNAGVPQGSILSPYYF
jgi:hypothetical protein